jgi:hypothetical protein
VTASGRTEAPYDVLTSRQALLIAAKLNLQAEAILGNAATADSDTESYELVARAAMVAQVSRSHSTYAQAVDRWSP